MARSPFRRAFIAPLLLGAWLLGACGDSTSSSGDSGANDSSSPAPIDTSSGDQGGGGAALPDACTLLTPDEINAQFQYQVTPGVASSLSGPVCDWQPIDFHPDFSGVQLTVMELDQAYFDFVKESAANRVEVPGLGEGAFFNAPENPFVLNVQKGNVHFNLYVVAGGSQFTPEVAQQLIINLANTVIARL